MTITFTDLLLFLLCVSHVDHAVFSRWICRTCSTSVLCLFSRVSVDPLTVLCSLIIISCFSHPSHSLHSSGHFLSARDIFFPMDSQIFSFAHIDIDIDMDIAPHGQYTELMPYPFCSTVMSPVSKMCRQGRGDGPVTCYLAALLHRQ